MRSISKSAEFFRAGALAAAALFFAGCSGLPTANDAGTCTYRTWEWDTVKRAAVNGREVRKPKRELTSEERGTTPGCTVCEEDQAEIALEGLPPLRICRAYAGPVERALREARAAGFPLASLVGYRVGRSKGAIDAEGRRTEFSNHSYGTALDVNSERNGLYGECVRFGPECRLLRGGPYRPEARGAVTPGSPIYSALKRAGFAWGGEIVAKQKDFMHFSLTGM